MNETKTRIVIGLDWSDSSHAVCIYDPVHQRYEHTCVDQKPEAFHPWIHSLMERFKGATLNFCLEQGKGPVLSTLLCYPQIECYAINPKSFARYREAFYPSRAKSDPVDAQLLADYLWRHADKLMPVKLADADNRKLAQLCENRRKLVDDRSAQINRLKAELKKYFPQMLEWFGDLTSNSALRFLSKWPSLAEAKKAKPKTILDMLYACNVRKGKLISELPEWIAQAVSMHQDDAITDSSSLLVTSLCQIIQTLNAMIDRHDQAIGDLVASHQDAFIFNSFPHAGKQMAPRLLAAFALLESDQSSALSVAERSGVAPVCEQSGQGLWIHKRFATNKFMQQTFQEYARLSTLSSVWARAYFEQQARKKKSKAVILRAIAFKWIRIMHKCWVDKVAYDEAKYLQELKLKGSPYCA
jgi:transposase